MILAAHADAGFLNESKARGRAGAHIFLTKNDPKPKFNGPVLTIAQIIKSAMASVAEAEMAALYITAQKMVTLFTTLIKMDWPQPKSPIQIDNLTAVGFTNKNIVNKATKSADMKLWRLRDQESQDQFRYYWAPGFENEGYYSTKHHPPDLSRIKMSKPILGVSLLPSIFFSLSKLIIPARVCCYKWIYIHVK